MKKKRRKRVRPVLDDPIPEVKIRKKGTGRPTKLTPIMLGKLEASCKMVRSERETAAILEVHLSTIGRWKQRHHGLRERIEIVADPQRGEGICHDFSSVCWTSELAQAQSFCLSLTRKLGSI